MVAGLKDPVVSADLHEESLDRCAKTHFAPLFPGVFLAGFECSEHRMENGARLDLLASTRHEEFADADYARMRSIGMRTAREGVSWLRAEHKPGAYDFSSAALRLAAAKRNGVEIIWDLMHFGWPEHVDVLAPSFPARFAQYARAFARWLASQDDQRIIISPINEMSFLSWAGGDMRCFNPFEAARGVELKVQLVLATIAAIDAIRTVVPSARFLQPEPVINIVPQAHLPKTWRRVESDNLLQFQAWNMLAGRVWPGLGGDPRYLDIIGVNFYPDNQFMLDGTTIERAHPQYRPFSEILLEVWQRYRRPMLISETGCEGDARADWLRYIADECIIAMRAGCELHGITLYPILNHPGWADGRHCENGLWDYADDAGTRLAHGPLEEEILRQTPRLIAASQGEVPVKAPSPAPSAVMSQDSM